MDRRDFSFNPTKPFLPGGRTTCIPSNTSNTPQDIPAGHPTAKDPIMRSFTKTALGLSVAGLLI
ncbi:hypothetical protein K2F54_17430, partial [Cryobacterium sp. 1639]|uniref:hypothetical protein n=1 Tax=Cryobacterium inferilacus TaxID=2866629 RepID=UPI001C737E7A